MRVEKLLCVRSMFHPKACGEVRELYEIAHHGLWRASFLSGGVATVKGECIGVSSACQSCFPALTVT